MSQGHRDDERLPPGRTLTFTFFENISRILGNRGKTPVMPPVFLPQGVPSTRKNPRDAPAGTVNDFTVPSPLITGRPGAPAHAAGARELFCWSVYVLPETEVNEMLTAPPWTEARGAKKLAPLLGS